MNTGFWRGRSAILKVLLLFGTFLIIMSYNLMTASAGSVRFDYTGSMQTYTIPKTGTYKLEVWGAQGGSATGAGASYVGGYGGYAYGTKNFNAGDVIYIFVGGKGQSTTQGLNGGFGTTYQGGFGGGGNGAGSAGAGGGGSTDIRLNSGGGTWSNSTGLSSRIIVAGGGGGGSATSFSGGEGGETSHLYGTSAQGQNGVAETFSYSTGYWGSDACGTPVWVDTGTTSSPSDDGGGGGGYIGGQIQHSDDAIQSYGGSSYIGGVQNGSTTSGVNTGNGYVIISSPALSITTPSSAQSYSGVSGNNIITISGSVSDPNGGSVTVSAAINGKTKSQVVNPAPTSLPGSDNFTLTWDVAADNIVEGTYSNIVITAQNGAGDTTSLTLVPILIVDKTAPTANTLNVLATQSTAFGVQANAADPRSPLKYLFNIGGVDVGTWQNSDTYIFTGLSQNTSYAVKYKVKDSVGNISGYSAVSNITTLTTEPTDYSYLSGTQTIILIPGIYTIEAWGAKGSNIIYSRSGGGTNTVYGGNGGYAKGTLNLVDPAFLYIVGSSGTESIRLNTNSSSNNILVGDAGGDATSYYVDSGEYSGWAYQTGSDGTGTTYSPLTNTTTTTGANSGAGSVKIVMIGQVPVISLTTPTTSTSYSAQTGYKTITIKGKVSDPDANNVTVSATINGKTKSVTVNNAPTSPPGSPNFTLTWDVASDSIAEGVYSNISVTADDGNGGTTSSALTPTITVDLTAPTINSPTSGSVGSTSFIGTANANDSSTPLQYLFNLNGVDQGIWQSGNTYSFTGLTANTTYTIKYKAMDSAGNISGYSGITSVTTAAPSPLLAIITEVRDLYNNDNASDIRVIFKGASNESKVVSYKIIVAQAGGIQPTDTVGASLTTAATNSVTGNYFAEPVKGKGRLHLFTLPSKMQTYDNKPINAAAGPLRVYVLSVAKTGSTDVLSSGVDLTSVSAAGHALTDNNDGHKITSPTPTATDISNAGDGSDMRVSFQKAQSEVNIASYAIIVQKVSSGDLLPGGENTIISSGNYISAATNTNTKNYSITLGSGAKDSSGTAIVNNVAYKVYIVSVGKNGYKNILSSPSKPIRLLATVPAVSPVRSLSAVRVGTGHDSSNISVTFAEPTVITNISEYRVFIVPAAGTLDVLTAAGINNSANTRYQAVAVTAKSTVHTLTLNSGMKTFDGTNLEAGDYKVYVLAVGSGNYAGRLSGISNKVTLN